MQRVLVLFLLISLTAACSVKTNAPASSKTTYTLDSVNPR